MVTNDSKCGIMLRNLEKKLRKIYGNEEEMVKNSTSSLLLRNQGLYFEVIPHTDWSLYNLVEKGEKSKLYSYFTEILRNTPGGFSGVGIITKKCNSSLAIVFADRWNISIGGIGFLQRFGIVSLNNLISELGKENNIG